MVSPELLAGPTRRFMIIHNHPSGNLEFSAPDLSLTRRIAKGAEIIGLELLDHILVSPVSHVSARDIGLMDKE